MIVSPDDVRQFRDLIGRTLGLVFDDQKLALLHDVLLRRLDVSRDTPGAYLQRLYGGPSAQDEVRALARELTVGETYFFRNSEQFHAFVEVAVPARLLARGQDRALHVLSIGCASGEEPYTVAMLLLEQYGDAFPWTVHALDANPAVIDKAKQARYSSWALRETPKDAQQRWFRETDNEFLLDERVRKSVSFEEHNLANEQAWPFRSARFDVVFCRNLLMYLRPDLVSQVIARIARCLLPGGFLFLGHAESLRGVSQQFQLCQSHNTFYYQTGYAADGGAARGPEGLFGQSASSLGPLACALTAASAWPQSIELASARIAALTMDAYNPREVAIDARPEAVTSDPQVSWDLSEPLALLKRERFREALAHVGALPEGSSRDPNVLLLRATLLSHSGDFKDAQEAANTLLQIDGLHPGAHFLLALCLEGCSDPTGAAEHDRTAIYLDPSFAMPHLHLGRLALREGDPELARRELALALRLLPGEDATRVLLFGGGFSRDALVAMCRSQLLACGGSA